MNHILTGGVIYHCHWEEKCYVIIIYIYSYPTALDMVASGKVNVKPLITHTYKLEETIQAFQRAKTGEGGAIKV